MMLERLKSWFGALSSPGKIGVSLATILVLGSAAGAITTSDKTQPTPPSVKSYETKIITSTETVPFTSTTIQDNTIAQGTTVTQVNGINGEKTKTWRVTYINGAETNRVLVSEVTTTQPINEVIARGTKPPTVVEPPAQSRYRVGAICRDGWQSTATGSGACSHHGGVDYWLYNY